MIRLFGSVPGSSNKAFTFDVAAMAVNSISIEEPANPSGLSLVSLKFGEGKNLVPFTVPLKVALAMASKSLTEIPSGTVTLILKNSNRLEVRFEIVIE